MTGTAVITGIGVAAPNGLGVADYWAATLRGESGIRRIALFDATPYPARLAGEVTGFVAEDHLPSRLVPQTDRMTQLALVATEWALADAGVDPATLPEFQMGVVTSSGAGGFDFGHRELEKLWSKGPEYVSAYQSFAWFYAVNSGQISIRHGMRGPSGVLVSDQAGGLDAVAQARRRLHGDVRLMVTGGMDSALCPWGWVAHLASRRLTTVDDPALAYLPFDARATGQVIGEGGAMLILETPGRRAGKEYGVVAGYGATIDPRPDRQREPGLRRAIDTALSDAELTPGDVDVVFADADGCPEADRLEAAAINAVFGRLPKRVPVTAPKTMTGRLCSGAAPLDIVAALLSIRDGVIPPTANVTELARHCDIDLVIGQPRSAPVRTALVLARGNGGFNSAMVICAPG